ncbi:hypothetical protein BH10CYA1_BH10CYA1_03150 [soil metagenome]
MAYKDRHGRTVIRPDDDNNLRIAWDYDDDESDLVQRMAVFLYTPQMSNTETHFHISLSQPQAKELRDWLDEFLKDVAG